MNSSDLDAKQATAILKMQMAASPERKLDLTKPVLMIIPFDPDKRKATGILDASEFDQPEKIKDMIEWMDMAKVKLAQIVYRFPDETESWVGDCTSEQMLENGKASESFIAKIQTWSKHATANPDNAVKFHDAPRP